MKTTIGAGLLAMVIMTGCASKTTPPPKPDPALGAVGEEVRFRMPRDAANEDRPVYILPRWSVGYHRPEGGTNHYRGGYVEAVEMEPGYFATMEEAELSGRPYIFVDEGKFMLPGGEGSPSEIQIAQMAARIKELEEQQPKTRQGEEDDRLLAGANRPALAYDAFAWKPPMIPPQVTERREATLTPPAAAREKVPEIELEIGTPAPEPDLMARAEGRPAPVEPRRIMAPTSVEPRRVQVPEPAPFSGDELSPPEQIELPAARYFSGELPQVTRRIRTEPVGTVAMNRAEEPEETAGSASARTPLVTELEVGNPGAMVVGNGKARHIELVGIGPLMQTVIVPPRPVGTVELFAIPGSVDRLEIRHLEDGEVVFKWGDKYYRTRFEEVPKQVKIYR
jgi:hypothetical protein